MEKYQDLNPFKFIIFQAQSGIDVPQMRPPEHRPAAETAGAGPVSSR